MNLEIKQSKISFIQLMILFFVGITILLNGCSKKTDETNIVKIGVILPLTGNASFVGEYIKNGIDTAVDNINSVMEENVKIKIIYGDSKNNPKEGISIFNKFVSSDKVPIIISSMSSVTQAIIPLSEANNIVLFATSVSASGITEMSQWVFRLFVTADIDAKTMAHFASDKLKYTEIGILHVNDDFGLSFSKVFTSTFEKLGKKIIFKESFDKGTHDYRGILTKIKTQNPDAIYILGYDNNLGLLPKQMKELKINVPILSIGTIAQPNVLKQAGNILDGTYFTTTEFNPNNPKTSEAKKFVEGYEAKYNKTPNYFAAFAHDSITLIAEAIKNEGSSPESIKKGLQNIKNFEGASGLITIKPNRDADFKMLVKLIKDGKIENIQ